MLNLGQIDDMSPCMTDGHCFDAVTSAGDAMCTICGHVEPSDPEELSYEEEFEYEHNQNRQN